MSNDQELYHFFKSHKSDISDEDFTGKVMRRLTQRSTRKPQLIILGCVFLGIGFTILLHGVTPFFEQVELLCSAISNSQLPTITSVLSYLGGLMIVGAIIFSLYWVSEVE